MTERSAKSSQASRAKAAKSLPKGRSKPAKSAGQPLAKSAKNPAPPSSDISEQWEMPVSFDSENRIVSLRDYAKGAANALSFSSLSDDQRTELAAKRIEMQPGYEMAAIGAGVVSKEKAAAEVRNKTKLGRRLAQIETRVIMHVIDEVAKQKG